jgi:hypothetical protein
VHNAVDGARHAEHSKKQQRCATAAQPATCGRCTGQQRVTSSHAAHRVHAALARRQSAAPAALVPRSGASR